MTTDKPWKTYGDRFGAVLLSLVEGEAISVKQVAICLGLNDVSSIHPWLRGDHTPSVGVLLMLYHRCERLGAVMDVPRVRSGLRSLLPELGETGDVGLPVVELSLREGAIAVAQDITDFMSRLEHAASFETAGPGLLELLERVGGSVELMKAAVAAKRERDLKARTSRRRARPVMAMGGAL